LWQTAKGPLAVVKVVRQEQAAAPAQCGVHARYRHLEHKKHFTVIVRGPEAVVSSRKLQLLVAYSILLPAVFVKYLPSNS
jgi:hypothetical protein